MSYIASTTLIAAALQRDPLAVARLLSRAESGVEEARPALDEMFARAGRAHVVGITGVPGSGKSTLVAKIAKSVRGSGRTIAIVAVDPSSPFSGGAILGDRIRMSELGGDPGVFVRSMATRGALGGLARGTLESVDVLDAAGFDVVVIETVGVGQDEVEIARAAHTTVVVSAPGLGDDIQAIKAGILEIADIHVVSKCDKPDANRTIADLKAMLALGLSLSDKRDRRSVPVLGVTALNDEGVTALVDAIDAHRAWLRDTGEIERRRRDIAHRRLLRAGEDILRDRFARAQDTHVAPLIDDLVARRRSPHAAAIALLNELRFGEPA